MTIFNLSEWDYDGNTDWFLSHPNKTEEDFKQDVINSMNNTTDNLIKNAIQDANYISSSDLLIIVVENLKNNLGYEDVKFPRLSFSWDHTIDEENRDFKEVMDKNQFQKIVNYNQNIIEIDFLTPKEYIQTKLETQSKGNLKIFITNLHNLSFLESDKEFYNKALEELDKIE